MKRKIQIRAILIAGVLLTTIGHGIAQPKIIFSDLSPFDEQPIILGQTPNNYFCLYPNDSIPELVIYNSDLKEESRIDWYSLAAPKPGITYQPFTLGNSLVVLACEKNENIVTVRCVLINEKGKPVFEKNLFSDYSYKGQLNQPYSVDISKNGKYILFSRGAKLDEKTIIFKGYLFDNDWNNIKQFAVPFDKDETEDTWDGAVVDIEGNIHSIVYTMADSWKLGSTISVYTISRNSDEARAEKIEVLKKRLLNYSLSEDTTSHTIRLQATVAWQHQKEALAGIAFIDIPYSRSQKIEYASYQLTAEQKKLLAKNITAEKELLTNTNIEFPSSFVKGGSLFTVVNVHHDYADPILNSKKMPAAKKDELYLNQRTVFPTNDDLQRLRRGYSQQQFPENTNRPPNTPFNSASITERIILLKNNNRGELESLVSHEVRKSIVPFYDNRLFPIIKNDSLQLIGYLIDLNGLALFLLTDKKDGIKKIETPGNNFLLFSQPCRINDTSSLFPFTDIKTRKYGLAKIIF
jgi:hypothetical protein